jgi:hypothetical protein
MNFFQQILSILCPPRLPRLGREDMADCAEYHNRLNPHCEADIYPPGLWIGRISNERDGNLCASEGAEETPQPILRRARARALFRNSGKGVI